MQMHVRVIQIALLHLNARVKKEKLLKFESNAWRGADLICRPHYSLHEKSVLTKTEISFMVDLICMVCIALRATKTLTGFTNLVVISGEICLDSMNFLS